MFDVITIGSASRDIFFITGRGKIIPDPSSIEGKLIAFTLGAKVSVENAYITDGGGACNAATAFARLGLGVAPYMNVGRDEMGEQIILELIHEGADTEFIQMDEELLTGTSMILLPVGAGDRTILFYSGANRNLRIHDWQEIKDTSWFYMGPITREAPEFPHQVVDFAAQESIKVANNPGMGQIERGFEYMAPILEKLDVLIVNRAEGTALLRSKDSTISIPDNQQLAAELIKMGPRIVVVTCGPEGSYATEGGEIHFQEAIRTEVVDVTGAGDAFGSTFVAAIIMGHDIRTAMFMAAINSASVVSKLGAQEGLLQLAEIRRRATGRGPKIRGGR
ncbi:MAG TPA: carbohydrate kinase family protein [Anaerolineae bacterium]|jgi:ribokinase|nr:carbohydrate kinase family protein [Anaerolineae bacterium]